MGIIDIELRIWRLFIDSRQSNHRQSNRNVGKLVKVIDSVDGNSELYAEIDHGKNGNSELWKRLKDIRDAYLDSDPFNAFQESDTLDKCAAAIDATEDKGTEKPQTGEEAKRGEVSWEEALKPMFREKTVKRLERELTHIT